MDHKEKKVFTIHLSKDHINHLDSMLQKALICIYVKRPKINDELVLYESCEHTVLLHGKRRTYLIVGLKNISTKFNNSRLLIHLTELSSIN